MITGEDVKQTQTQADKEAMLRDALSGLTLEELYQLRGEQYTSKGDLIEDIIENDDGTLEEVLTAQGSLLSLLVGQPFQKATLEQFILATLVATHSAKAVDINGERFFLISEKAIRANIDRHLQDEKK